MFKILFTLIINITLCLASTIDYETLLTGKLSLHQNYVKRQLLNNIDQYRIMGMNEEDIRAAVLGDLADFRIKIDIPEINTKPAATSATSGQVADHKQWRQVRNFLYRTNKDKIDISILKIIDGRGYNHSINPLAMGVSSKTATKENYEDLLTDIISIANSDLNNSILTEQYHEAMKTQKEFLGKYHVRLVYYLIGFLRKQMGHTSGSLLIERLFNDNPITGDRDWHRNTESFKLMRPVLEKKAIEVAGKILGKQKTVMKLVIDLDKAYPGRNYHYHLGVSEKAHANEVINEIQNNIKKWQNKPHNNLLKLRSAPNPNLPEVTVEQDEVERRFDQLFGVVQGNYDQFGYLLGYNNNPFNPGRINFTDKNSDSFFNVFLLQDYLNDGTEDSSAQDKLSKVRNFIPTIKRRIQEYWRTKGDNVRDNVVLRTAFIKYLDNIEQSLDQIGRARDKKSKDEAKDSLYNNLMIFINGFSHCPAGQASAANAVVDICPVQLDGEDDGEAGLRLKLNATLASFRYKHFTNHIFWADFWGASERNMQINEAKVKFGPYFGVDVPRGGQAFGWQPPAPSGNLTAPTKMNIQSILGILDQNGNVKRVFEKGLLDPNLLAQEIQAQADKEVGFGYTNPLDNKKKHWVDVVYELALSEGLIWEEVYFKGTKEKYYADQKKTLRKWRLYFTVEPHGGEEDDVTYLPKNDKLIRIKNGGIRTFLEDMGYILVPPKSDSLLGLNYIDVWKTVAESIN